MENYFQQQIWSKFSLHWDNLIYVLHIVISSKKFFERGGGQGQKLSAGQFLFTFWTWQLICQRENIRVIFIFHFYLWEAGNVSKALRLQLFAGIFECSLRIHIT